KQERELIALKRLEEAVPVDRLERLDPAEARVVDSQDARIAVGSGALDARGMTSARLDPMLNGLVVGRGLGAGHAGRQCKNSTGRRIACLVSRLHHCSVGGPVFPCPGV